MSGATHPRARRGAGTLWSALLAMLLLCWPAAARQGTWLARPERIADGVDYFTSTDQALVEPQGPVAVYLLRLDPARVRLASVHAHDEIMGQMETVDGLAARHDAIAAVNGGFFDRQNGDPMAVLKEAGEIVSDSPAVKGAVIIRSPAQGRTQLDFDQISLHVDLAFTARGREWAVPIDGVDTTRARGKLMLYTRSYHADSDTAPTGTEWAVSGTPSIVTAVRPSAGHTPIPRDGFVLSFGGTELPETLRGLAPGTTVGLKTRWRALNGLSAKTLDESDAIVNGAGLLRLKGRALSGWEVSEKLSVPNFIAMRHPRTLIGVDRRGAIWLAAIDGRQPAHSVGMDFSDLERLCERLDLTDALNLDGGGSTTMVVTGKIVNMPSDAGGPRPVGDAIIVLERKKGLTH